MRKVCLILIIALLLFSAGCAPVAVSELYSLPQVPDEYVSLQSLIDTEIAGGCEYSSPIRGSNRQSVQLYDLNGSGQFEALAFFRTSEGALKICIYESADGIYSPACTITGEGSSISRVEFADMDGDGISARIVAWQMSGGVNLLCV